VPLVPDDLAQWIGRARRDDWHTYFVGSDIRCMLAEIERLRAAATDVPCKIHAKLIEDIDQVAEFGHPAIGRKDDAATLKWIRDEIKRVCGGDK
jgi:hypothetical protein